MLLTTAVGIGKDKESLLSKVKDGVITGVMRGHHRVMRGQGSIQIVRVVNFERFMKSMEQNHHTMFPIFLNITIGSI